MITSLIESKSNWARIMKPVMGFFSVQLIVQILTLLGGLLIVRSMSKNQYAYYTISNTIQGTINILADSGISSALSSIGGLVWQDRNKFGELIQTALGFRRKFGLLSISCIGPILFWLLYSQGAGLAYSLLLSICVLAGVSVSLTHGVLIVVPRLHGRIGQLQKADLAMAALRLVLIGAACLVFLNAVVAAIISLVTLAIQNILFWRWAAVDANLVAPQNIEYRNTIWKLVKQQAPNSIFYCIQGQIVIFLVAIFGSTRTIADVGALGRLTVFFTVISSVLTNVILPRFSRCQDVGRLKSMYLQVVTIFLIISSLFLLGTFIFPNAMLFFLGSKYSSLQHELIYMVFASVVSSLAGVLYSLNAAKGWLRGGWLTIPIIIFCQIALIPLLNLRTVEGAVLLGSLPILPGVIPYVYRAYFEMKKMSLLQNILSWRQRYLLVLIPSEQPIRDYYSMLPKLSIVTPSFNQGQFLEETICSVLDQGYKDLEYIIVDGGSTDNSVEIIRKYSPHLTYWVSEKDDGQTDAINKGLLKTTGEIIGWVNSDDRYLPGTFAKVVKAFEFDSDCILVHGDRILLDGAGQTIGWTALPPFNPHSYGFCVSSETAFWRRSAMEKVGLLDSSLRFAMDLEFFSRLYCVGKFCKLNDLLGCFRCHDSNKSSTIWDVAQEEGPREWKKIFGQDNENWAVIPKDIPWRHRMLLLRYPRLLLFPYLSFRLDKSRQTRKTG